MYVLVCIIFNELHTNMFFSLLKFKYSLLDWWNIESKLKRSGNTYST